MGMGQRYILEGSFRLRLSLKLTINDNEKENRITSEMEFAKSLRKINLFLR